MRQESVLRAHRKQLGETVSSMARKLKIGISRYHMIETGERPAEPELADRIAEILKIPKNVIFSPHSFTVRKTNAHPTGTEGL